MLFTAVIHRCGERGTRKSEHQERRSRCAKRSGFCSAFRVPSSSFPPARARLHTGARSGPFDSMGRCKTTAFDIHRVGEVALASRARQPTTARHAGQNLNVGDNRPSAAISHRPIGPDPTRHLPPRKRREEYNAAAGDVQCHDPSVAYGQPSRRSGNRYEARNTS